jgi:ribosomal 50S subunit-recycling heat shock protein
MRIDKFLKTSRLIKRRAIAKDACEQGRIFINGKAAKPGSEVKEGDVLLIQFGNAQIKAKVLALSEHSTKESAATMYEIVD